MWIESDQQLCKQFEFADFAAAFAFMTAVAFEAERQNHHPWWSNVWNKVDIRLCTHDAGNRITDKDRQLADAIDQIAAVHQAR